LGNSVKDMWEAGVYPLSLLIAVFSGAWPYLKLLAMFICWMIHENKLSYRWREKFLVILDTMGKWSKIKLNYDKFFKLKFINSTRFKKQR
jgi:uncharacterized paraquat-inducible protein A